MVLDRDGRVTLANSSLLKVAGTDRNLVGKTPLEVFRRPELENAVKAVLAGDSIQTRVERAIDNAAYVLIILSPNSVNSRWVQDELKASMAKQRAEDRR